jgi:hypothetical protein
MKDLGSNHVQCLSLIKFGLYRNHDHQQARSYYKVISSVCVSHLYAQVPVASELFHSHIIYIRHLQLRHMAAKWTLLLPYKHFHAEGVQVDAR